LSTLLKALSDCHHDLAILTEGLWHCQNDGCPRNQDQVFCCSPFVHAVYFDELMPRVKKIDVNDDDEFFVMGPGQISYPCICRLQSKCWLSVAKCPSAVNMYRLLMSACCCRYISAYYRYVRLFLSICQSAVDMSVRCRIVRLKNNLSYPCKFVIK
jgi:hypothetical protein